jgi:hypothetical protein
MTLKKVRKKMMINIPKCPKCGSDTAPDLLEVNVIEDAICISWYEELYECKCGCRFMTIVPRKINDEIVRIRKVEHKEEKFCLSTIYC